MHDAKLGWLWLGIVACGSGDGTDDGATDATDETPTDTEESDTEDTDTEDTDTPTTGVTVLVEAAAGGTVEAFGATLEIPPGSLSADTEITVVTHAASGAPDATTVLGDLFDFGPDGLVFDVPATLTLPAPGNLAIDERLVLSWLDGGSWTDLASTTAGATVSGAVAHFTTFAARAVLSTTDPEECAPVAGCGGNATGDWTAAGTCRVSTGEVALCPSTYITSYQGAVGGLALGGDGNFQRHIASGTASVVHTVASECLPVDFTDCADLYATSTWTCTGDQAAGCECSDSYPAAGGTSSGTWTSSGTELVLTQPGEVGTIDTPYQYCVDGDTLTLWAEDGEPDSYTRAP